MRLNQLPLLDSVSEGRGEPCQAVLGSFARAEARQAPSLLARLKTYPILQRFDFLEYLRFFFLRSI